ncbi:MAG TPA: iron-sulfur cluster carrier protein ApbC [Acidobacteriota bacterium]|nr:iron-sulfur cluster carrier protein ApbC [Acidobacteriota bacterium]
MTTQEASPVVQQILQALRNVRDPDLGRDIVSLGFVKNVEVSDGRADVTIELTTPACPVKDKMRAEAEQLILGIPGIQQANVNMTAQVRAAAAPSVTQFLPGVKNTVAVASGKGGVGKSTVSANLALALQRCGARVGLLDADIYGPSIPTILGIAAKPAATEKGFLIPVEQFGLKVISVGFFIKEEEAVIWRGPMLNKLLDQFLGMVEWGDLDYLIVDLPPGTGDVQLSLCQKIPLAGAIIVSTPQDVAIKVAQKAITMFRKLNTPILGMIENMSYFVCPHCGQREEIFGSGGAEKAAQRLDIPFLGKIPLATSLRATSDSGRPEIVDNPESPMAQAFIHVAENMAAQISIAAMKGEIGQEVKISF